MKTQIETTSKTDVLFKCSLILFVLSLIICVADNQELKEIIRNSFQF